VACALLAPLRYDTRLSPRRLALHARALSERSKHPCRLRESVVGAARERACASMAALAFTYCVTVRNGALRSERAS
jgi:hypothetical protein